MASSYAPPHEETLDRIPVLLGALDVAVVRKVAEPWIPATRGTNWLLTSAGAASISALAAAISPEVLRRGDEDRQRKLRCGAPDGAAGADEFTGREGEHRCDVALVLAASRKTRAAE